MSDEPLDRDERVAMPGADPEAVLRALLQVDPESEPVDDGPDPRARHVEDEREAGDPDREREPGA